MLHNLCTRVSQLVHTCCTTCGLNPGAPPTHTHTHIQNQRLAPTGIQVQRLGLDAWTVAVDAEGQLAAALLEAFARGVRLHGRCGKGCEPGLKVCVHACSQL